MTDDDPAARLRARMAPLTPEEEDLQVLLVLEQLVDQMEQLLASVDPGEER